ncbi:hypothetical protein GCM10007907_05740 [Chitinimonas prasina]|uniref:Major facilitator superfamily (MFS) profile domain-containing protein n=1 Tax=Chitinimonas prasina TaxID=1434937 RepID=A0ABQ5YAF0_9NEIS|nr:fused MFS/spermidine synthase [Chitinimonas prasina]GLR11784.1 hypothetical protein GCM10007907_05740 [Chitinimonas prasina]
MQSSKLAIANVFTLSGAAGLIYQICWQRLLFGNFGVDMESITIVVSAFMLGLGLGGWFGGRLADRYPDATLNLFALFELGIALFGMVSPMLIGAAGDLFSRSPSWQVGLINFILVLPATFVMGATLPLLTTHFARHDKAVGESIGLLYFFNTMGAALGALACGFVLFRYVTLNQAIGIAVAINVLVAVLVKLVQWRQERVLQP